MLNSKQLHQVDPIDVKGLAKGAHRSDMREIGLLENMVTVTCSGTIGRIQILPKYMEGWAASQDAIRLVAADDFNPGYLYAWLASPPGNLMVRKSSYGAVVVHIDSEMLSSVPIPIMSCTNMDEIGDMVLRANDLRHEAWELERQSISELESYLSGDRPLPTS